MVPLAASGNIVLGATIGGASLLLFFLLRLEKRDEASEAADGLPDRGTPISDRSIVLAPDPRASGAETREHSPDPSQQGLDPLETGPPF